MDERCVENVPHNLDLGVEVVRVAGGVVDLRLPGKLTAVATLDLRVDYLRPVSVEQPLTVRANCHRHTAEVGFVSCDIRAEGADAAAALVTASFTRRPAKAKAQA